MMQEADVNQKLIDTSNFVAIFSLWSSIKASWVGGMALATVALAMAHGMRHSPRSDEEFVQVCAAALIAIASLIPPILGSITIFALSRRLTFSQVRGFCDFPWNDAALRHIGTLNPAQPSRISHALRTHWIHERQLRKMTRTLADEADESDTRRAVQLLSTLVRRANS